jgi:hypothetical protein
MKRLYLMPVLALTLAGCGDAYDEVVDACTASRSVKDLPAAKAENFCACQAEMAREKKHPPEALRAFAAKWRGEKPENVPVAVQGDWFLIQLRCLARAGIEN